MRKLSIGVVAAAMILLVGTPASADLINVDNVVMNSPYVVHLNVTGGINSDVYAGQTDFYYQSQLVFQGFCDDVWHLIGLGGQSPALQYQTGTLTDNGNGNPLSLLIAEEIGDLAYNSLNTTALDEAAAQIAIWKVEYGALVDITIYDSTLATAVDDLMADLGTISGRPVTISSDQSPFPQGFTDGGTTPAPEPATLALLLAGLAGMAWAARKGKPMFAGLAS